jgi:hypothetical protein
MFKINRNSLRDFDVENAFAASAPCFESDWRRRSSTFQLQPMIPRLAQARFRFRHVIFRSVASKAYAAINAFALIEEHGFFAPGASKLFHAEFLIDIQRRAMKTI